jgi:uncharacterized protein
MRIGITGATGFIGNTLGQTARHIGHHLIAYTRNPSKAGLPWAHEVRTLNVDAPEPLDANGLDVLVHLAGEPILGLWTQAKKQRIRDSRVELTHRIARCLASASPRPQAFLCASASGVYGDGGDDELSESAPAGSDFMASVCQEWEAAARRAEQLGIRVVNLRTGMVLGHGGGAWPVMNLAFENYLGGRLGSGKQWMPWIHVQDAVHLILWAAEREDIAGQLNISAPTPVTNATFTTTVAKTLERLAIAHAPAWPPSCCAVPAWCPPWRRPMASASITPR